VIYRITFGFSGAGVGWSETHAMLNASTNPNTLIPTLRDIAQKRVQMLGREFAIVGIRISKYSNDAGVRQRGAVLHKETFRNSVQTQIAAAEPAVVALLVRGSAEPSQAFPQFDANQNQTFLGAPLDVCVDNAGSVDTGKGGLQAAFAQWRSAMLNTTIGWLASETIVDQPIKAITKNTNGTVNFEFEAGALAPLSANIKYKARIRQVNQGVSPLNGELLVTLVDATHLNSVAVIGLGLAQQGGSIRIYKAVQPFIDYGDLELSDVTAKHQRGRPFGSVPGRAKKRIRG
jgi:hypothetical protein